MTDPSAAVIAVAAISINNTATNAERSVETNEAGRYTAPFLNPGIYDIRADREGFKTAAVSGRQVQAGDSQRVDITLEIGVVTDAVEVQAGARMLKSSSTALDAVIDQQRIVEMPLNGRNYLSLVKLSPNVSSEMPTDRKSVV